MTLDPAFAVFIYQLGWPFVIVGLLGIAVVSGILAQALYQRDCEKTHSDDWVVAVHRQKKAIPWLMGFLAMFMVGVAVPAPDHDVRYVDRKVVVPNSFVEVFSRCIGKEGKISRMETSEVIAYQRERAARAQVCQTVAREETTRMNITEQAKR
jgi:hypothetical protein